jgi:hypothetical protein
MPFIAFFDPGEPGHPFEELPRPFGCRRLDRRLRGGLGEILGEAGDALGGNDPGDGRGGGPGRIQRRQHDEAGDPKGLAHRQHAGNAEARRQPAAGEIGHDARELIEQEQERQGERRVAELEEMQQYEHAERTVDQGEPPIRRRDDQIVANRRRHHASASITMLARSIMRQA